MEHAEGKTSDLFHRGFQAIQMPSSLKQEASNSLTEVEETSEALIKTWHIKWGQIHLVCMPVHFSFSGVCLAKLGHLG